MSTDGRTGTENENQLLGENINKLSESLEQSISELKTANNELKKDPIRATLVDMTKLNLAEVTRKKVKKSLREQLGNYDYRRN